MAFVRTGPGGGVTRSRSAFSSPHSAQGRVVSRRSRTPIDVIGGRGSVQPIQAAFMNQQGQARADQEAQYKRLLESAADTTSRTRGLHEQAQAAASGVGESARARVEQGRQRGQARAQQSLVSRGLGNTTITESAARGVDADAARAQGEVDDMQARIRSGLLTQQAGAEQGLGHFNADSILSRQIVPPNANLYMQLIQQLAGGGF